MKSDEEIDVIVRGWVAKHHTILGQWGFITPGMWKEISTELYSMLQRNGANEHLPCRNYINGTCRTTKQCHAGGFTCFE